MVETGGGGGDDGEDRTVVAVDPHRAGDIICRVPRDAAWETAPDLPPAVPAGFIAPSYWATTDAASEKKGWYLKLAIKLLYERSLRPPKSDKNLAHEEGGVGVCGLGGKWGPYLEILPKNIDTLAHFSDRELAELQNARLVRQIRDEQAWLQTSHSELNKYLSKQSTVSLKEWQWALDCVRSRTFKVKDRYCMCPLMDLFNHNSASRTSKMSWDDTLKCYQLSAGLPAAPGVLT